MSKYKITAAANLIAAQLLIYGDIGTDYWADEANDAVTIIAKLNNIPDQDPVDVRINSYGGSVIDGMAIYNALKRRAGAVTVYIDGVAMSAAADIAMAGDTLIMAANGLLMLHGASTYAGGNATDHRATADMLEKYNTARATNYAAKSGKSIEEITALLNSGNDHYYTAAEALAEGFIDQVGEAVADITASANQLKQRYTLPTAWLAMHNPPQENPMTIATETENPAAKPADKPTVTAAAEKPAEVTAEAKRQADINALFQLVSPERKTVHAMKEHLLIDNTITVDAARKQILAKMGESSAPIMGNNHIEMGVDGRDRFIADAVNGMLMKSGIEKRVAGNKFAGMPLSRIAEECLIMGRVDYSHDRREMVAAAFTNTTSDYPIILENVMHKTLLNAYRTAPNTWNRFCKTGQVSDFRAQNRYRTGSIGNLDNLTEAGEFKFKSIPDGEKETIKAATKGNIIRVTREMIINDDMSAFVGISSDIGKASARTIEAGVYVYLASNPVLSDGKALFHADHKNIGTAAAPSMQIIEDGRVLMAAQTGVGAVDILDIAPKLWLGGLKYGGSVRSINRSAYDPDTANKLQKPNIVENLFSDVIDTARINGNVWYMFADPNEAPVIEVAFLDGNQEPIIEMQDSWTSAGAEYRAILDFGIAAVDYRGGYYNAGA